MYFFLLLLLLIYEFIFFNRLCNLCFLNNTRKILFEKNSWSRFCGHKIKQVALEMKGIGEDVGS